VATVDFEKKTVLAGPDMLSRGFIYMRESGDLIRSGQRVLFNAIREAMHEENANEASVARAMREALSPFLYKQTERSPLVVPMIMTPDEK
jgi:ribonuclease J